MSSSTARGSIAARGISKRYHTGQTEGAFRYRTLREDISSVVRRKKRGQSEAFWALRDVTFDISGGETVGVIGRNGAGKSTLLKILSRITLPSAGRAVLNGRLGSLLEVGTGFHPELTGRENIFLSGAVLGMSTAQTNQRLNEIVEFSGVEMFLDTPIKRYSSGMYLRLAFAVAAHLEPDILLVDEVLAVGDADFQKKCLNRMSDISGEGRTVIFVSHSMSSVMRLCPRVLLLDKGSLVDDGPAADVVRTYLESGLGTTASREWTRNDGPGDDVARLRSVRVVTEGAVKEEVDIGRGVSLEVEYWKDSSDERLRPCVNLHFFNENGTCLFVSNDFNNKEWFTTPRPAGLVKSVCNVPAHFFAEGRVTVTAAVSTFDPTVVHAIEHDAVAFQVVDRTQGEGVRGVYANEWPGVLRPLLEWEAMQTTDVEGAE